MTAKRMALIRDGVVHDVIIAGPGYEPPHGSVAVASDTANKGDSHDGSEFKPAAAYGDGAPVLSKAQLIDYARRKRYAVLRSGIDFNLSNPGDDPRIVRFPVDAEFRYEIVELAHWATRTDGKVKIPLSDQIVELNAVQLVVLRDEISAHIAHGYDLLSALIEGIENAHIAWQREIDAPETATAVKLPSWWAKHG